MYLSRDELINPIKQDTKNNQPRYSNKEKFSKYLFVHIRFSSRPLVVCKIIRQGSFEITKLSFDMNDSSVQIKENRREKR
jgi:hypothetical protein